MTDLNNRLIELEKQLVELEKEYQLLSSAQEKEASKHLQRINEIVAHVKKEYSDYSMSESLLYPEVAESFNVTNQHIENALYNIFKLK
jgi:hypothetical protein